MSVFSLSSTNISPRQISKALDHIENYWDKLTIQVTTDQQTLIGLPNSYVVPSSETTDGFVYKEMYYWDNYFIIEAMLASGRVELARGIVDNMLSLIKRYGLVPNANRYYMLSRSQPPLLTSMILAVHNQLGDEQWLANAMSYAEQEYSQVWMGTVQPNIRRVYKGLSRYYDINVLHELAEAESGWDYTPRFDSRCLDFLPVDLNSYLHKYETDLAAVNRASHTSQTESWLKAAQNRAKQMRKILWDADRSLFVDYDFINRRHSQTCSLASFTPLFVGLANAREAEAARQSLIKFETKWGLVTTTLEGGMHVGRQWALPNGWAPTHYMVIRGLQRYGYQEDAARIADKWLRLNLKVFNKTGKFYEKYNVLSGNSRAVPGVYPSQVGFGWTNAVFAVLAREFVTG